jgi:Mg-chelatase subunit ChlI
LNDADIRREIKDRFELHIEVEIITNALTLWGIFNKRAEIHDQIVELHSQGFSDKEIARILNQKNIQTPRNTLWAAKKVWHVRKYISNREARKTQTSWKIKKISVKKNY